MLSKLITPRGRQWLRNTRSARILHLSDGVCNLVNDRDEVVSLVAPRFGPGPFTIVLDSELSLEPEAQQVIAFDHKWNTLSVGSWVVDVGEATLWQPKPDWARLQSARIADGSRRTDLPTELEALLEQTVTGITAGDAATFLTGVEGLAGRGEGLTPGGDDVLMGILHGLWVWRRRGAWKRGLLEAAVPRTTTLSANFLRAAAAGEAVWQWHALANGSPDAVAQITSIGHTSGAYAWAGFVFTWLTLHRMRRPSTECGAAGLSIC